MVIFTLGNNIFSNMTFGSNIILTLTLIFTLATTKPLNVDQIGEVWEKTRDIDSPLMPWTEIYAKLDLEFFIFKI